MNWFECFVKIAGMLEDIRKEFNPAGNVLPGVPITKTNFGEKTPEEMDEIIERAVIQTFMEKQRKNGVENPVIDPDYLENAKRILKSKLSERTEQQLKEQQLERQQFKERREKTTEVSDDEMRRYIYNPYQNPDAKNLPTIENPPVAMPPNTPVVQRMPTVIPYNEKRNSAAPSSKDKTQKMDYTVGPDGKMRFRLSGTIEHPASGKLCVCSGRMARVGQCYSDEDGNEFAVVRYVDDGDADLAILLWNS
jgi:hypothetical protein